MRPSPARSSGARAALLASAALLAGCADGQGPTQRQGGGAVIGALAGAGIGALAGDGQGAAIGAGIGALLGAGVGTWLDAQEQQLEQDLAGTGAEVVQVEDALLVTLPNGVTFDFDSADLRPEFRRPLNRVAATLNAYPESRIAVVGHADSTGDDAYNQTLSERRAAEVAAKLARQGVARQRLAASGMGERAPVASNATEAGRAANRRVEILITPNVAG